MRFAAKLLSALGNAKRGLSQRHGNVVVMDNCQWCGSVVAEEFLYIPQKQSKCCKCYSCGKWVRLTRDATATKEGDK